MAPLPDPRATLKRVLAEVLPARHVIAAYLYGSHATGLATAFSDVDIALLADGEPSIVEQMRLESFVQEEIYRRLGSDDVDVRVLNGRSLLFEGRVLTEGILLYSGDDRARVAFETRIRSLYFDFLPVVESQRAAFFRRVASEGVSHGRSRGH